jgi:amidase
MARTVTDPAITLGVLTGMDPTDPITATSEGKALTDYTNYLTLDGLKGARIGIDYSYFYGTDEEKGEIKQIIRGAIEVMKAQGAIVEEVTIPKHELTSDVLYYEFKHHLNDYLKNTAESVKVRTLEDVIKFNEEDPEVRMKFTQDILVDSQNKSESLEDPAYLEKRAEDITYSRELGIDKVMAENNLDALLFANNFGAALPAKAGYPSITVPAGYTRDGMPVGVTFTSKAYCEPKLIELAYSYEQHSKKRVEPKFE